MSMVALIGSGTTVFRGLDTSRGLADARMLPTVHVHIAVELWSPPFNNRTRVEHFRCAPTVRLQ